MPLTPWLPAGKPVGDPQKVGGQDRVARTIRRWLILGLGWLFVIIGIVGLFLPILQGLLFILIGLVLLSSESAWLRRRLDRLRARYPQAGVKLEAAEARARRWLERLRAGRG